ncbi:MULTISPECIES: hypothetical protein [Emticicia]|uniref:hypothetical protein n=1 Tax=Emticicia TaxID=312278 RepID=UPI00209F6A6F|nr:MULTISPECIES: hypothetical protein [Emticicia]UTA70227.1 hypothetical protein MB380_10470 [Emticicia sp. 21SJ11W-3]
MKTISLILVFFVLCLQGCKKENPESSTLEKCEISKKEGWFVEYEIKEVTGTILKNPSSTNPQSFLIELDYKYPTIVIPCNLPSGFETPNTKVIVSGKIYNHPLIDFQYFPMELTFIKLIK